jgi:GT2 family glycosyltransferase
MEAGGSLILTGRVLAAGDKRNVPSIKEDTARRDYTGTIEYGVLYTNNVVMSRSAVLEFGAFDERFETAEDNDLCYRWLKAGRRLRFEPRLAVWHHDWRTPAQMRRLYHAYWRGAGVFYAKHLRAGDMTMLRYLARDSYWALQAAARRDGAATTKEARGIFRGLPAGLIAGLAPRGRRAASRGEHTS